MLSQEKRKWILLIALILLLIVVLVFKFTSSPSQVRFGEVEETVSSSSAEALIRDVENADQMSQFYENAVKGFSIEDADHQGILTQRIQEKHDEPHEAVSFLIGAAMENDVNFFSQAFHLTSFTKSIQLLAAEGNNPMEDLEEYMNTITKDGKLSEFEISKSRQSLNQTALQYEVMLFYEDEDPASFIIEIISSDSKEGEDRSRIAVIDTPPHEIIQQLN